MSRKYKFYNSEGLYFVSFATVYWLDVFVREEYCEILVQSLKYCQKEKGMEIFDWCIMPSHVHLIFSATDHNPSDLMRDFKKYTSIELQKAIGTNPAESRKEWLLWMMKRAGSKSSNVKNYQFWQQHNKPIELWSNAVIDQKVEYIHNNPVEAGFVSEPQHWKYSSANENQLIKLAVL
ncbi:MAG: transposase [Bacteroidia bacterium]